MNEIQKKLIERYKKGAIDWYSEKTKAAPETIKKPTYEEEDLSNEIQLIEKIEHIIENSNFESSRKAIFIGSLKSSREELKEGSVPERLPNIVRNLCKKESIGNQIKTACELATNGGKSYAYLWGL